MEEKGGIFRRCKGAFIRAEKVHVLQRNRAFVKVKGEPLIIIRAIFIVEGSTHHRG